MALSSMTSQIAIVICITTEITVNMTTRMKWLKHSVAKVQYKSYLQNHKESVMDIFFISVTYDYTLSIGVILTWGPANWLPKPVYHFYIALIWTYVLAIAKTY